MTICHDKKFVTAKDVFCGDKILQESFLSQQKFCRDKSHDKHTSVVTEDVVCHDKTFIAMKMIFVAAPTNDTYLTMYLWWSYVPCLYPHAR